MLQRCENLNHDAYRHYGGRGIIVCKRWHDFSNFLSDMGRKPSRYHSIERINNNLGYSPDNCYWATSRVQRLNQRYHERKSKPLRYVCPLPDFLVINGVSKPSATWAREYGVSPSTVNHRLKMGWNYLDALTSKAGARGVGRRANVFITFHGVSKSITEWSIEMGVKENTIRERLRLHPGWPAEKILFKHSLRQLVK